MGGRRIAARRHVRVYDFRRPDKFSKEQIRALQMIHEAFARSVTTAFSAQFRILSEVSVDAVEQVTYGEFMARVDDPAILAVVALEPLAGSAVMELDYRVAFPIIDRLFGGPGQPPERPRALTDIEATVIQRVVRTMFESLAEAWANILELRPTLQAVESNPMFAQIVAPGEMCANIGFQVRLGAHRGALQFCLPFITLEPILPKLSSHRWFGQERHADQVAGRPLAPELERLVVDLWACLGTTTIRLGDLLRLRAGDVLRLDRAHGADIELFVEDRPKFRAQPGRVGKRLAVLIKGPVGDADGGGRG